ncbi:MULTISPECIES: sugar phosphate isomerase/epimerase [Agrobacterium]|uniref:TIM barrel protein n=1 Tax=Agrobacterium tumefaciens TaxID=358 RepID=A0AAE6BHG1_AGRTU|nr:MULTISPECIES: sugar phosphate isomerase/epimerase family protein [Agrobacterium]QCL77045.1 TIM barrel protein [Agrobacterium tumefaciens]QCL82552.1 TIM barrel protein [Agrobacterium tumefaciens]CUX71084.1 Xylose isomerase domain protein TIM barrel [Agrobacterium sp. NCPPB 925]
MIINTFSYLWKSTAVDAMCELTKHRFTEFEVPIGSPHCWPDEMSPKTRSDARERLKDHGASVRSLNAGGYDINLASPGANMRRKSVDHIKDVIELAVDWAVTDVVISPGTRRPMISPTLEQAYRWFSESLDVLLPVAEQAGVHLLVENTPYCWTPTIGELVDLVKKIKSDNVSIVYDVANAAYIGEDPVAALLSHHSYIGLVHISDTGTDVWGHDPIGTGIIDFESLGRAVDSVFNVDRVVLEVIREEEPLLEINNAIQELKKRGWSLD